MLHAVPIKIQTAILVAIASGMRIGDLVQLKISDIDFDSRPIKIRIRSETTRTKESRETFLTNEATQALKDYMTKSFGWHDGNSNPLIQDRIVFCRTSQMKKEDDQMKFKSVTIAENVLAHSMLQHMRKIPELNKLNENGRKMIQGTIPRSGIDIDARWGFSGTKGWLYGYKLHMSCITGPLVVPLSAGVTPANVYDNQMYQDLTGHLIGIQYIVADAGCDDWRLYDYTKQRGARLVCPVRKYRHTKGSRLELISFYKSRKGQKIYGNRGVSI